MKSFLFGHVHGTKDPFRLPKASFTTHWHLIGGTGKGKTTAIHTMLHGLLLDPVERPCMVIVDRMGNLSFELLMWMASEFCTDDIRRRLIYIEAAREESILPFNPLLYATPGEGYYRVAHAMEVILRGWASQNIAEMPRLARWLFNAFWAAAQLGLTIADCMHFLMPRSPYHKPLLDCLPERLKYEWQEIMGARSGEAVRILESTRNRLNPFFEAPVLRRMFGSQRSSFDVRRFIQGGNIVLLNLAPMNRIPEQLADAIGGLVINEVLTTARSLPVLERRPTYLFLDEFQRFVGPDIETAIPEVRQLGIRLILSHQSLSQLVRGDTDLTSLIFQAQSRMVFGVQGQDADDIAQEFASLTFDPYRIKDEIYTSRQRISGHRIMELQGWAYAENEAKNWAETYGRNWSDSASESRRRGSPVVTESKGTGRGGSHGDSSGGSRGSSYTHSTHQQLVPIHEDYVELAARTYVSFEESRAVWGRDIRRLKRGEAFVRLADDETLHHVDVKRDMPGHLAWDVQQLSEYYPRALDQVQSLTEENFRSPLFAAPADIDRETEERLARVLQAPAPQPPQDDARTARSSPVDAPAGGKNPFPP